LLFFEDCKRFLKLRGSRRWIASNVNLRELEPREPAHAREVGSVGAFGSTAQETFAFADIAETNEDLAEILEHVGFVAMFICRYDPGERLLQGAARLAQLACIKQEAAELIEGGDLDVRQFERARNGDRLRRKSRCGPRIAVHALDDERHIDEDLSLGAPVADPSREFEGFRDARFCCRAFVLFDFKKTAPR